MLLSNTLKYLPSQVLAPLSQFLSIILWTYFGDEKLIGYITLITAFQELAMAMFVNWWMHYAMREYGTFKQQNDLPAFWQSSRSVIAISSVLMVIAALINLLLFIDQAASLTTCILVALYAMFRASNNFNAAIASLEQQIVRYSILTSVGPFVGLFIGVALLQQFGADPIYPLLGYVLGEMLASILAYRRSSASWRHWSVNRSTVLQALHYGFPMIGSALFAWLILQYPRYFIASSMSLEQAGLYAVGVGLGLRIASLITMMVTPAALPLLFKLVHEKGEPAAVAQLQQNLLLLLLVLLPGLVGLYAVMPVLIPLLVEQRFVDAALLVMPWALLAGGIEAIKNGYLNHYFFIRKRTGAILGYDAAMAVTAVVLSYFLVSAMGIKGGAVASTVALALGIVIIGLWLLLNKRVALPYLSIIKMLLAVGVMYLLVQKVAATAPLMSLLLKIAVGALSYTAVMLLLFRADVAGFIRQRKAGVS